MIASRGYSLSEENLENIWSFEGERDYIRLTNIVSIRIGGITIEDDDEDDGNQNIRSH